MFAGACTQAMAYLVTETVAEKAITCTADGLVWMAKPGGLGRWEARCAFSVPLPSAAIASRHYFSHINSVNINCRTEMGFILRYRFGTML